MWARNVSISGVPLSVVRTQVAIAGLSPALRRTRALGRTLPWSSATRQSPYALPRPRVVLDAIQWVPTLLRFIRVRFLECKHSVSRQRKAVRVGRFKMRSYIAATDYVQQRRLVYFVGFFIEGHQLAHENIKCVTPPGHRNRRGVAGVRGGREHFLAFMETTEKTDRLWRGASRNKRRSALRVGHEIF